MPMRRGIASYVHDNGVLDAVHAERHRQDAKWGEQNHDQMTWLGILAEEFGEAAKEINELYFGPLVSHVEGECGSGCQKRVRDELIQVAAVAVAMVESLDRNGK